MRARMALPVLVLALLAGCGGASHAAAHPPAARSLAAKLGCGILGPGMGLAAYDTRQDLYLDGSGACAGGEVWTFPSAGAQRDWLHQAQIAAGQQPGGEYDWMVVGNLWAVYPGDLSDAATVARVLGGKQVTF